MISTRDDLVPVEEVAKKLRKTPETIQAWCRSGKLKATKIGRDWYTLWQHVDELAQPNEAEQVSQEEYQATMSRLRSKYGPR